ncbi:MAG TPA: FG-GAP-like repeat-containing protein [Polyangiaceae bacterium]|nr:FG-GAP-like repeat-containing protein [Polyangiaceae bacterium]
MRASRMGFVAVSCGLLFSSVSARASGVDPSRISLPRGPGSVEGLAMSDLSPSLATGSATHDVPIAVPPGAGSFGPKLSLSYDSAGGITEIGIGWKVSGLPAVRRRTADGLPRFDETDTFEVTGLGASSELLEVSEGVFRPRIEDGSFVRLSRDGDTWEARTKAGVTYRFGGAGYEESAGDRVAAYLLRDQTDRHDNRVHYEWDTTEGHALPLRVVWSDAAADLRNEVVFQYESRPDTHRRRSSGILETITRRLSSVEVRHGGSLVRRYALGYGQGTHPALVSVQVVGADGETSLPPARFSYTEPSAVVSSSTLVVMSAPPGASLLDRNATLADLNGDGRPDLLVAKAGAYRSFENLGGAGWGPSRAFGSGGSPSLSLSDVGVQIADVDADGAPDLVVKSGNDAFRYFPNAGLSSVGSSVAFRSVAGFSFEDPDVRLADVDGDRRTDVLRTTRAGIVVASNVGGVDFTEPTLVGPIPAPEQPLFSEGTVDVCDVNGDRVTDLCELHSGGLTYFLGFGRGSFGEGVEGTGVPAWDESAPYRLADLDGDGWADLYRVGVSSVSYALAVGEGRFGALETIEGTPERTATTAVELADMNGSGSTDIVWADASGDEPSFRYLELFPDGRAGLLRRIDDGLGEVQTIEYAPAARFVPKASEGTPKARLNVAIPVVVKITVEDSLGDPALVTEQLYEGGAWDPAERAFAGFSRGTRRTLGDSFTPSLVTEDTFDLGLVHRAMRGRLLGEELRDESGRVFSRTEHAYETRELATDARGTPVEYASRSATVVVHVESADPNAETRSTRTEWAEDDYGNVVEERRDGEVRGSDASVGHDETRIVRTFVNDPDAWLLGLPSTEEISGAGGARVSASRRYYDGLPLGAATRGDATREEAWAGPDGDAWELVVETRWNAWGLPVETTDGVGGGRVFEWAPDHVSLLSETVKLGNGSGLTARAETDGAFGTLTSVTGYDGETTRYRYDALGRLVAVERPGDDETRPTVSYEYDERAPLSRITTRSRRISGEDAVDVSEVLYDGLGRARAELAKEGDRWALSGVSLLDARGNPRRTLPARFVTEAERTAPALLGDGDGGKDFLRDALGREIRTRSALGVESRTEYLPLERRRWDGGQADSSSSYAHVPSVERLDGQGRVVAHERALGQTRLAATYEWDALGRLLARTDPEGNRATYEWDGRGRRTAVHDPDVGSHRFSFDAASNLVSRTFPDGKRAVFTYDLAGRALSDDWNDDGVPEAVRTWDVGGTGAKDAHARGRLGRVVEPSGATEYEYDARGRVTETRYTIGERTYAAGTRWDAQDREIAHVYPDGSSVSISRNGRGLPGAYGELFDVEWNASGLESSRNFSSGATITRSYDADLRRTDLVVGSSSGDTVEALHFSYDSAENLVSVADRRPGVRPEEDRSEAYAYDDFHRLQSASGTWGRTEWRYSPSGNLLARESTVSGQSAHVGYGTAPHAPTSIGDRSLSWDARGRLLDDGVRSYDWDDADRLARVSEKDGRATENAFAADGTRRRRVETLPDGSSRTTLFLDAWTDVKDEKLARYVVHGGERVVRLGDRRRELAVGPLARSASPSGRALRFVAWFGAHGSEAALFVALVLALLALGKRRFPAGARLLSVSALLVATATACRGDAPAARTDADPGPFGTVLRLEDGDVLLGNDPLGSLLVEGDSAFVPRARFAAYPFGVARFDGSTEERKYANTPRDASVGLDQMGARSYAPDLGIWTSGEPLLVSAPERFVGPRFATANPYAYAALSPEMAVDRDGHFAQLLLGALVGAAWRAAGEVVHQIATTGHVDDLRQVGIAAGRGALEGAIVAAVPVAGIGLDVAVHTGAEVLGGVAERLVESRGKTIGTTKEILTDAAVGALHGVAHGVNKARASTPRGGGGRGPARPSSGPKETEVRGSSRANSSASTGSGSDVSVPGTSTDGANSAPTREASASVSHFAGAGTPDFGATGAGEASSTASSSSSMHDLEAGP